jgi:hypothetical protein
VNELNPLSPDVYKDGGRDDVCKQTLRRRATKTKMADVT